MPATALLYNPQTKNWLKFEAPLQVYTTTVVDEVIDLLKTVEEQVEQRALHAVGFVSYEASRAFEPTAKTLPADDFPLLWFGLFAEPKECPPPTAKSTLDKLDWKPTLNQDVFSLAVSRIKEAIAAGETYQVNFTFPMTTSCDSDPWRLFCDLVDNQPESYSAWIDTGRYAICSASPELFFERHDQRLISKPMKGTTSRGMTLEEDLRRADGLQSSTKERAENIMVLDMVRNDLARLPGGPVQVEEMCKIEMHPTVWQMTSTAATATNASLTDIFKTLFPCASITGAPKLRTMHHIARLETEPRGLYTGAIGHIAHGRQALFSVAIRTAVINRETNRATYGVGAGITWDSDAAAEYRECLVKAQILEQTRPSFALLETILWEPKSGYFLLDEHLQRLQSSARYFNYPCDRKKIDNHLRRLTDNFKATPHKVRLLLKQSGVFVDEVSPIELPVQGEILRVRLARTQVASSNPFLYHKTTARSIYEAARQAVDDCDEILLYNEHGELTEGCNFNLVAKLDGVMVTPPVSCGLLAGTLRAHLLATGKICEQTLLIDDLPRCEELYLINSVRKWQRAELIEH